MFWRKKNETPKEPLGAPPPWENINDIPGRRKSSGRFRFNLVGFISAATGFSLFGTKMFLLGFAVALAFLSFIVYQAGEEGPPLPPRAGRPAIDGFASTTFRLP